MLFPAPCRERRGPLGREQLTYKAAWAGRQLIAVNAAFADIVDAAARRHGVDPDLVPLLDGDSTPAAATVCDHIHRHEGAAGVRRILGVLSLARKHGPAVVEDAATAALELGVPTYRFLKRTSTATPSRRCRCAKSTLSSGN